MRSTPPLPEKETKTAIGRVGSGIVRNLSPDHWARRSKRFAELELSNPRKPNLAPINVKALADTGALMLCIPEHVALQLELDEESLREVSSADGRKRNVPYVGPIKVRFQKRFCYVGALVLGDETLLGAVPMEDMDLVVNPAKRELTVDPESPNIPHARVKKGALTKKVTKIAQDFRLPARRAKGRIARAM